MRFVLSILALAALLVWVGCSRERHEIPAHGATVERKDAGPVTTVASEDPEMNAAIDKARSSLDSFLSELAHPKDGAQYAVKVRFKTDSGDGEHIWLDQVKFYANDVSGRLTDEPADIASLHKGKTVMVNRSEVTDWAISDENGTRGGYTDAVLERQAKRPQR